MEMGFNAGHSAELFLTNDVDCVTSFDLDEHEYLHFGKKYIDARYRYKHDLFIGGSKNAVPRFPSKKPDATFDFIFIDGGHDYETATADLKNCRSMARDQSIVVLDDVIYDPSFQRSYNVGPTRAWRDSIRSGHVQELGYEMYSMGRGMSWGRYL